MRAAAMADLHLGYRGAGRSVAGRNQRELDVELAFRAAVDNILAADVDLLTVAGDVFDKPSASNHAVRAWRDGVRRLTGAGIHVVVAQGNHDAARTAGVLSPIWIPEDYDRLYIATEPTRIPITIERTGERVSVAVFPFVSLGTGEAYRVEPDPDADVNVLLVHAAVKGSADGDSLPYFYGSGGALDVKREVGRWDAICVGDYHEFTRLHPTALAFYSGSIERTSSSIWSETAPKGAVVYDTVTHVLEFVKHPTRPMFDLPARCCEGDPTGADGVNEALAEIVAAQEADDALVRLTAENFPREERDSIDWKLVRELKSTCTHFHLDLHLAARDPGQASDRRAGARRPLVDEFARFAESQGAQPAVAESCRGYLDAAVRSFETAEVVG